MEVIIPGNENNLEFFLSSLMYPLTLISKKVTPVMGIRASGISTHYAYGIVGWLAFAYHGE